MLMTCCEVKRSNQQGRTSHTSRDREKQCPNTAEMNNKASALKNIIKMPKASKNKINTESKKLTNIHRKKTRNHSDKANVIGTFLSF